MSVLEVRVLGPFTVLRAGQPLPLGRSKLRDLLALLVAHAPEVVSADAIVDELWQGSAPPSARKLVQKHISELRQLLGRSHVVSLSGGYALRDVGVDSAMFDMAFEQARSEEPRSVCERLTDALAMWRGEPYADVDLDGLQPLRARLNELRLAAIEQLNEARLSLGELMPLIADLERLTIEHPVREPFWSQLMRALYGTGRQSDALRAFQRLRAGLARELGIEPSGELRQLEQRILAQDPELGASSTSVADVDPGDAHRRVMTIVAVELDDVSAAGEDPEDRARSMKATHEQIREWCDVANGTIESSMGSRLLIAFGAPAHEDDADRAVHLAKHLVAQLPAAKASLATGWALVQPDLAPGAHIVGSVVEVACSGLAATPRGTAHVDHSTTAARTRPIADPPFVGRERELTIAGELLSGMLDGHGPQAISVRGEPGVGKTRLVRELRRRSPDAITWLHVRCANQASPSAPLGAIVREHIALADSASESEWLAGFDALLGTLLTEPGEREWLRRRLGPAAGLGEPSMAERSEVVAAWVTYFAAVARRGPTVIVLDDVHLADPAFDTLLTDCFAQLHDVPLLVLSTARPEHPGRALQFVGTDNLTFTLRGLDASETDELLDHLLADDPVTEAQHVLVRARSSGNPLYAIQFARMLRQRGWSGSIPHSTRSLISARLDLLAPLERALLFAGAVADQPFGAAELAAMQGVDAASAGLALRHLVDKALLNATARDELSFTHDLVREVAYEHLSRTGRARLHEAAATWMEQRAGDRLADDAMRIANQLAAAAAAREEDGEDATDQRAHVFRLTIVAGDRLRGLGIEDTASRLAEAVQADHAPADLAELQRQRAMALARVGLLSEAANAARQGLEAARQVDDRPLQARLSAVVGEVHWLRGDTASCIGALEEAMTLVDDLPMDRAATEALASLAFITALLGRPAEAIALAERGLILARDHGLADREVRCLNARGAAVLLQGNIEGYTDFMRALTRALEAGLGHESAMGYHNLAELQLQGVGTASSIEMNERGLELAERRGLTLAADWLRANRVEVFFEAGRWDEALDIANEVLAGEGRSGHGQAGTVCAVWSARIHVWRGSLDRANQLMDTFLPRARQHAVIQQVGPALVVAGLLATASGRPDEGAAYAEEYCVLTEVTRAYRHMEIADVVRLLVAASRTDRASAAADSEVIPTLRNECESRTAEATLARARGDATAAEMFYRVAEMWSAFGHPLEEFLALRAAVALRPDPEAIERSERLASGLRLGSASVATLCAHHAPLSA